MTITKITKQDAYDFFANTLVEATKQPLHKPTRRELLRQKIIERKLGYPYRFTDKEREQAFNNGNVI
mgnify:CR=1 FL=1